MFRTPEPTPDFATGTEPSAAAVIGVMTVAIPRPPTMRPGKMSQKPDSSPSREKRRSETATSVIPAVMSQREPIRSEKLAGRRSDQDDQHRHGQEGRARLDGRVAEDVLHVEGHEEEDTEHGERDQQRDDVRAREGAAAKEREVEHRRPLSQLEPDEGREGDGRAREEADDHGVAPAVGVRLDEREGEREEAQRPRSAGRGSPAAAPPTCHATP